MERTLASLNIAVLLQVLVTLPVTTAQVEHVYSKVDKTASSVRASMLEECLQAYVLLQCHRDKLPEYDTIINRFATNDTGTKRLVL